MRIARVALLLPVIAAAAGLLWLFDRPAPIFLQGGELTIEGVAEQALRNLRDNRSLDTPPERSYFIAQFERALSRDERARLQARIDVRILDAIPTDAFVISVPTDDGEFVFDQLLDNTPMVTAIAPIRLSDRLSDELLRIADDPGRADVVPEHLRRPQGVDVDDVTHVAVFVRFFADVPVERQREVLQEATDDEWDARVATLQPFDNLWSVWVPPGSVATLLDFVEVQAVNGAPRPIENDMDDVPPIVQLDSGVAETGAGVTIAQWELCQPDAGHQDLADVWVVDNLQLQCDPNGQDPQNDHATVVAGVVTGDGVGEEIYAGIAPGARLLSFDTEPVTPISEYPLAMGLGATVSTNSWGFDYDVDLYSRVSDPQDFRRWYPVMAAFYDATASGRAATGEVIGAGWRMLIVASAGNRGHTAPWSATRIRSSAKNAISVGNVATGAEAAATYKPDRESGRGPTIDGRISPVLVAPGVEVKDDGGITSTMPKDQYGAMSGTSFSTPIVAGAAALVTEKFKGVCADRQPTPAELRAILINTAKDLTNAEQEATPNALVPPTPHHPNVLPGDAYVGPDYIFGFGLVQIADALDFVARSHFVTNDILSGYTDYPVTVSSAALLQSELRVTLVWDDPPFSATAAPSSETGYLQNDLDLILIDPDGTKYFPWTLDPDNPEQPATASVIAADDVFTVGRRDSRNTVEQVVVAVSDDQLDKQWTIRVRAPTMYLGPQEYTLVSGALTPATACGDVPSVSSPFLPPESGFERYLLILALLIFLLLLMALVRKMWRSFEPQFGARRALVRIIFVLLLLAAIVFLLLSDNLIALSALLIFLLVLFFAF